jgi:hypothetical protein
MSTTSKPIPIPQQGTILLSATAFASFTQQVTFQSNSFSVTFTGAGEGVPMTTLDGQQVYSAPAQGSGGTITLVFTSSGNRNPRVQAPFKTEGGGIVIWHITSEDDTDDDDNDTYALVQYALPDRKSKTA